MDTVIKHRLYQVGASLAVALFIISTAFVITAHNRKIYKAAYEEYYNSRQGVDESGQELLSVFEATLNYEHLADGYSSFFQGEYDFSGYKLCPDNESKIKELKVYYRVAWISIIISLVLVYKFFKELARRRTFGPLLYGGLLGALITTVNCFIILVSKSKTLTGIRNMILEADYSYFSREDILISIIPPDFARYLLLAYIFTVFILIVGMALIRWFIIYCGRPHRF